MPLIEDEEQVALKTVPILSIWTGFDMCTLTTISHQRRIVRRRKLTHVKHFADFFREVPVPGGNNVGFYIFAPAAGAENMVGWCVSLLLAEKDILQTGMWSYHGERPRQIRDTGETEQEYQVLNISNRFSGFKKILYGSYSNRMLSIGPYCRGGAFSFIWSQFNLVPNL